MTATPAQTEYRTWILDSRRWAHYRPRPDDVVIATYPKCGTTWMQRIVSLLIFQTPEPMVINRISAWIDRRFPRPIEALIERIEAQKHRRFLKTHLPFDGLPFFDDVKYIHVARDGRDACMSFHNHGLHFPRKMVSRLNDEGAKDETIGRPYPNIPAEAGQYFHQWVTRGEVPGHHDGSPTVSFFQFEKSWWKARDRPNVLLVHYNDLKADLSGEMKRVADFLGVSVGSDLWPQLVEAATFDAMQRDGDALLGYGDSSRKGRSRRFFFKGSNERWRDAVSREDLALYDAKVAELLPPACAQWVEHGRLAGC
jgi:aryl sulfotransferase